MMQDFQGKFDQFASNNIVGCRLLTSVFYEDPLFCLPLFFSNFVGPLAPPPPLLHTHTHTHLSTPHSFCCFVSLTEWVISPHLVLFYLMTLWIYTCRALVSEYHKDQKFTLQSFKMSLLFKNDCLVKVTCLLIRFNKTKLDSIRLFP